MFRFHFSLNKTNEQWNMQRQYNNYKVQCKLDSRLHWPLKNVQMQKQNSVWGCTLQFDSWCMLVCYVGARSLMFFFFYIFFFLLFFVLLCFILFCFDFCLCRIDTKHRVWLFKTLDMIRYSQWEKWFLSVCLSFSLSLFAFTGKKVLFDSFLMPIIKSFLHSFFFLLFLLFYSNKKNSYQLIEIVYLVVLF